MTAIPAFWRAAKKDTQAACATRITMPCTDFVAPSCDHNPLTKWQWGWSSARCRDTGRVTPHGVPKLCAYSGAMKTLSIAGMLGAGIFLSGSETTVVDRRRGSEGYYDNGRGDNRTTSYRTGNVKRTNVYENNVYETNVHRNTVNRTVTETDSNGRRSTVHGQVSAGNQAAGGIQSTVIREGQGDGQRSHR